MDLNSEAAKIPRADFDSRCPYCRSHTIYLVGGRGANLIDSYWESDDPAAEVEEWRCAACFRSFILY